VHTIPGPNIIKLFLTWFFIFIETCGTSYFLLFQFSVKSHPLLAYAMLSPNMVRLATEVVLALAPWVASKSIEGPLILWLVHKLID